MFKQKNNYTVSKRPVGRYALITSGIIITLLGKCQKLTEQNTEQ